MKILYIYFHNYSDMPYHVREWVEAAQALGHEVAVLTSINPEFLRKIGWEGSVAVHQFVYPKTKVRGLKHALILRNFRARLKETARVFKPDIVYERYSMASLAACSCAAVRNVPYAVEVNGILSEELTLSHAGFLRLAMAQMSESYVLRRAGKIIAVTPKIKEHISLTCGIEETRIQVMHNGVNADRFSPRDKRLARRKFNIPENAFVIGYLGSLFPWQDLDLVLDVAGNIKSVIPEALFLIGGGQEPMFSRLKGIIASRNLGGFVTMVGQIPWDVAADFTSCFDVGLSPLAENSDNADFSPLKIASYMACECPFITANFIGARRLAEETGACLLYKMGDRSSFISTVVAMHGCAEGKRREMGRAGRKYALANLTWTSIVDKTLAFITAQN